MKRRIFVPASISLLALSVLTAAIVAQPAEEPIQGSQREAVVVLTVDYGDGAQKRFPSIPWKKSLTVLDALHWADRHPRGIEYVTRGRGETTLVTQIDDLKNGGGGGRNWIYEVNGKLGDRSCAVLGLEPGDAILWKFRPYQ